MSWDVCLFDLDGTLTDSEPGVTNGIIHALASFDLPAPGSHELRKYLGPPLWFSFREYAGFRDSDLSKVVEIYRDYYHEKGQFENSVFTGMTEVLAALVQSGKRIAVATSKVESSALSILNHFALLDYFETVVGADELGVVRGSKGLVITEALSRLQISSKENVVMIGDREHDVHGAAENEIQSIGVLWGYGGQVELETAGVHHLVESPQELHHLLLVNAETIS